MNNYFLLKSLTVSMTALSMLIIPPFTKNRNEFSEYRVVIDPGHGGVYQEPVEKYGDRYDIISQKYKEVFREGTVYKGIEEHVIMYQISAKVQTLLEKTESDAGFEEFSKILEKYTSKRPVRIIVRSSFTPIHVMSIKR